jgi:histone H3
LFTNFSVFNFHNFSESDSSFRSLATDPSQSNTIHETPKRQQRKKAGKENASPSQEPTTSRNMVKRLSENSKTPASSHPGPSNSRPGPASSKGKGKAKKVPSTSRGGVSKAKNQPPPSPRRSNRSSRRESSSEEEEEEQSEQRSEEESSPERSQPQRANNRRNQRSPTRAVPRRDVPLSPQRGNQRSPQRAQQRSPQRAPTAQKRVPVSGATKSTNRRKNRHPKSLNEIVRLQSSTEPQIPKAPFSRLVRELLQKNSKVAERITPQALEALRESSEQYITQVFSDANLITLNRRQVTLQPRDIQLLIFLRGPTEGSSNR